MKVKIKVNPKAKTEHIVEAAGCLKVYVTAAAESGKANTAAIKLLAKHFNVAPSKIVIISGRSSREKIIRVGEA